MACYAGLELINKLRAATFEAATGWPRSSGLDVCKECSKEQRRHMSLMLSFVLLALSRVPHSLCALAALAGIYALMHHVNFHAPSLLECYGVTVGFLFCGCSISLRLCGIGD
eukprot:CAMPEP_0171111054 /NCGR_PEP_ID=MMETSP0766_2-20121228/73599_1 /TAXON_ID=439317 /ORGANISM="Gambierdiscus australes, Strain CAWD 149" /LENGTH=111 /DNA_ID=CAMNT_0011572993 /DNA_START=64 /DNA_END=399 /DNA_ORIENTATION=-